MAEPLAQEAGGPLERLAAEEVKSRAATGAAILGARGLLIYAVGIGANLVLARLLVPRDFGIVALGTVLVVFGTYLAEGGFGAALIRREEPPERAELAAVTGLQLGLTVALASAVAAVAAWFGRDGLLVATMVASLPIAALRTPSVVVLERRLHYRAIAKADVVEALTYYVWAIGAVALGFGVWGMATAVIVRALAGTATLIALGPLGLIRPRWDWSRARPLVAFGAKVQATVLLSLGREQGLNVGVAAVAGLATLGVWNLAWRVLQVPSLLFLTFGRVAFPAMSRLLGSGENPRPVLERGVAMLAVLTGAVMVGLVGFAPALPEIVGHDWGDVPAVLLWSGIALILGAPIAVATSGYLFAADAAGVVATATVASGVVWFGVALPLLPELGAPAVGVGWVACVIVNSGILGWRTVTRTGAAIVANQAKPTVISLVAALTGWFLARAMDETVLAGLLGLAAGELLLLAGLAAISRPALRDSWLLVGRGLRGFRADTPLVGSSAK